MAKKEHSDGRPDGQSLGQSATDLVGFHGATPSDQRATTASIAATFTASGGFGFTTSADAIATVAAVNEIINLLKEKGLMASS